MRVKRAMLRLERSLLQRVYGFDRWHVGHAGEQYAADIVRYLNARPATQRGAVVEIGCGLGDILRHLQFRDRLGLDRDPRVLEAARLLARWQSGVPPRFDVFDFPQSQLSGAFDAIIMVNWIHEIAPQPLREAVHTCLDRHLRPGGCLVLDTVSDPAYRYNHGIHALARPGVVTDRLGVYPRGREVWAVRASIL